MSDGLAVCHEASGVIGVWKPSGLPSQAPTGIDSAEARLRGRLGAGHYLGVPHRLDRAVSGIMLFAATPRAARQLSRQFERRTVRKTYLALADVTAASHVVAVLERLAGDGETWEDQIEKIPDEPRARIVTDAGGKQAITRARLLGHINDIRAVLLELEPQTGRMHQLRVQAAARGLPILGDAMYGGPMDAASPSVDSRARAIALHAWRIEFTDPDTKDRLTLEAPFPAAWPTEVAAAVTASAARASRRA